MDIEFETEGTALVACPKGRIDGLNAREFADALNHALEPDHSALVLDFSEVTYISSVGLGVVYSQAKAMRQRDAGFAVCSLPEEIHNVFRISGASRLIPVYPSRAAALAPAE